VADDIASITKNIQLETDKVLDEMADFVLADSQRRVKDNGSIDTGFLVKTANVNRKFLRKEITYPAPYAAFVEYGTTPHMPPIEPIKKYLMRKTGMSEKEATNAAWAVAKRIAKEGTEPKPFLRPALIAAIAKFGGRYA
jgi:hypothetical protein